MKKVGIVLSISLCLFLLSTSAFAKGQVKESCGQTIYVPAKAQEGPGLAGTRLEFRNLDRDGTITITSVGGYDKFGQLVQEFLTEDVPLDPLESWARPSILSKKSDDSLSRYAHKRYEGRPFFLLEWEAPWKVVSPNAQGSFFIIGPPPEDPNIVAELKAIYFFSGIVIEERRHCGKKGKKD